MHGKRLLTGTVVATLVLAWALPAFADQPQAPVRPQPAQNVRPQAQPVERVDGVRPLQRPEAQVEPQVRPQIEARPTAEQAARLRARREAQARELQALRLRLRRELQEQATAEEARRALQVQHERARQAAASLLQQLQRLDDVSSPENLAAQPPGQQMGTLTALWNRLKNLHARLAALSALEGAPAPAIEEARALLQELSQRARTLLHRLHEIRRNLQAMAQQLEARAAAAEKAGRLDEAIAALTEAAAADPENRALVAHLVALRRQAGQVERRIWVRGQAVDASPVIQAGRSLVPLRALAEALGAEVSWDGETQTVTFTKNDNTVQLQIGSNVILYNGEERTLDVPAQIIGDRTHVPLRAVAELLNADVGYDGETGSITVIDPVPEPDAADDLDLTLELLDDHAAEPGASEEAAATEEESAAEAVPEDETGTGE